MWKIGVIGFVLLEFIGHGNAKMPSYFKPCSKSKDFKACCIAHGNEALPYLLKGDKEFEIPNLLPLTFPQVDIDAGPNLKLKLKNVKLMGMETVTLKDMEVDFDKQTVMLDVHALKGALIGEYEVDGKIMVLPVQGSGGINITIENSDFKYIFSYKLVNKGGKEYATIQPDDRLEYKIGKAYFHLENLFNGNKAMGDNVNNFLNENDQDVIKELGGAVEGTVKAVAYKVGGGILDHIAFEELFLE